MAASSVATRPGDARSATLFLGGGPPKNTYGGPLHTSAQKYIRRGRTLPYPNLWASADPLPWGSSLPSDGPISKNSGALNFYFQNPKTQKWATDPRGPKFSKMGN